MKNLKLDRSDKESGQVIAKPFEELKTKPFLSIAEPVKLLGISIRTVYRMMDKGVSKRGEAGTRSIINRFDIDKLFSTV
jgi:hypothetical protein